MTGALRFAKKKMNIVYIVYIVYVHGKCPLRGLRMFAANEKVFKLFF